MKIFAETPHAKFEFEAVENAEQRLIMKNEKAIDYDIADLGNGRYSLIKDNKAFLVQIGIIDGLYQVRIDGAYFPVQVEDEKKRRLKQLVKSAAGGAAEQEIKAPIPGLVVKVKVKDGQQVKSGETLLILEAMKMENIIKAPCDCTVKSVYVKEKDAVHQNQKLLKLAVS